MTTRHVPAPRGDQPTGSRSPWSLAGVLSAAMGVGIFTQFAIGALAPFISVDLGLSRAQVGIVSTSMYIAGGVGSPFLGRLADRIGGRWLVLAIFASAGTSWVTMSQARTLTWLAVAVLPAGLALAASNPATNLLVATHVPERHRGLVIGLKQSGGQVATIVAGFGLPPMAAWIGWRPALLSGVIIALGGYLASYVVIPSDRRAMQQAGDEVEKDRTWKRDSNWLAWYGLFVGAALAPLFAYLPLYAVEEVGLSTVEAGRALSVMAVVGIISLIGWGHLADRFGSSVLSLLFIAVVAALAQLAIALASNGAVWLLWLGAAGAGGSAIAWFTVGMALIIQRVPRHAAGRASGWVLLAFFAGLISSPIAFGHSVDVTRSYAVGWAGSIAAYLAASGVAASWLVVERTARRSS